MDENPTDPTAVVPAGRSSTSPTAPSTPGGSACRKCSDTGLMRWQQPMPAPGGGMVLREMTHPCTCQAARDAGLWHHPAAEEGRVVDADPAPTVDEPDGRVGGRAAAAQRLQPGLAALLAAADPRHGTPPPR